MEINWDSIRYIFQVPKDWYSYIHRKIHNAYGTLFIRVLDGEYGGMKIDIDRDLFNEAVEDAVDLDGYVKSVNNIEPDEDGNVEFSVVESVDGVSSVDGNVPLGAIRSINGSIRPVNGNVDLTGVFAPTNHTHPHTQISDWSQATISFLETTDITSPGVVVGIDYDDPDHPVCNPNHKHKAKDIVNDETNGFVTLDTEQVISGKKTFSTNVDIISGANGFTFAPNINTMTFGGAALSWFGDAVLLGSSDNTTSLSLGRTSAVIGSAGGGEISINQSGVRLDQGGSLGIVLDAKQNDAMLTNSPSKDNAPDLAIATCGWVKEKALTVPDGKTPQTQTITLVTNVTWNGTQLVIQKKNLEFSNGVLTNVTNATSGTINTVAYSPS